MEVSVKLAGDYGKAMRELAEAREEAARWAETVRRLRAKENAARMEREDAEEAAEYAAAQANELEDAAEDVGAALLTALRTELED